MNIEPAKLKENFISNYEIEILQKKQHEYKLIEKRRKVPGHIMFSYNIETGEIKKAIIEKSDSIDFITLKPLHNDRIKIERNCYYEQALNKCNFIKRLKRIGFSKGL